METHVHMRACPTHTHTHSPRPTRTPGKQPRGSTVPRKKQQEKAHRREAEGKLLPSMFIGALAKYEYGSGTPFHSPVSLTEAETQGVNLLFFPL